MKRIISIFIMAIMLILLVACAPSCPPHFDNDGNGVCDGCYECVGEHIDEDINGKCDICDATVEIPCTNHKDDNCDGKCDTDGCDASLAISHIDSLCDGICDKCGGSVSIVHTDSNTDGVCDKCQTVLNPTPDPEPDEPCDECVDEDEDGFCDNCQEPMPTPDPDEPCDECVDEDEDGFCDNCQEPMPTPDPDPVPCNHVDDNCDGICDNPDCLESVTIMHIDNNCNGKCDKKNCGADVDIVHTDLNHDYKCDKCSAALGSQDKGDVNLPSAPLPSPDDPAKDAFNSMMIGNNTLEGYKIIYAESSYKADALANPDYYPVWDFNKETAERIADLIYKYSGVKLSVACDTETAESDKEILVGKTNRSATSSLSINSDNYKVAVSEKKLIICGAEYGTTWHAVDYIEELLRSEKNKGSSDFAFASDLAYNGSYELLTIACIGDSITYGSKCDDKNKEAYAIQLQRVLWKDVKTVYKLGKSGSTLRLDFTKKDVSVAWMNDSSYTNALKYAPDVDIFTIMLGTNDAYYAYELDGGWDDADTAKYKEDYETLISSLYAKNNSLKFIIMNAPYIPTKDGSGNANEQLTIRPGINTVRQIQKELVFEMKDKGYDTYFFDMYQTTLLPDVKESFPDYLHPNSLANTIMGKKLADYIDSVIINPAPTSELETIDPVEDLFESMTIGGNSIADYVIIYAESEYREIAALKPQYYPVWDFNRETAERLANLIYKYTGVKLSVACDTDTPEGAKEILIGKTNRSATSDLDLATTEYVTFVRDDKLVISGGVYGTTWHAVDYIENLIMSSSTDGSNSFTFASDFSYNSTYELLTIGCIGDSITYGRNCFDRINESYPAQLQRMLWKDVVAVYNFGHSGTTMRLDMTSSGSSVAWMNFNEYQKALELVDEIDIFTVMLGTNDSARDAKLKPPFNVWSNLDTQVFKESCETLFKSLYELNNSLQFVIMNAPAAFGEAHSVQKYGTDYIRNIQYELVDEMNEKGYETYFFNMYEVTKDLEWYYDDELHPDSTGTLIMAEELGKWLEDFIKANR